MKNLKAQVIFLESQTIEKLENQGLTEKQAKKQKLSCKQTAKNLRAFIKRNQ